MVYQSYSKHPKKLSLYPKHMGIGCITITHTQAEYFWVWLYGGKLIKLFLFIEWVAVEVDAAIIIKAI